MLLDKVCRGCDLTIAERTFVFEFIVIDMTAFDVILGMDWLSSFRAVIDCYHRGLLFAREMAIVLDSMRID